MSSASTSFSISVVIPLFNGGRWIDDTLDHIAAQEFSPLEVIVVDDGSTDNGPQSVKARQESYVCSLQLLHQDNSGVAKARNRGIAVTSGTLIALLDQDDIWPADALRHHIDAWEKNPMADATWGSQKLFLESGTHCPRWLKPQLLEETMSGSFLSGFVARKETFNRVGLFDEKYSMASDTDWFARAREAHLHVIHLSEVTLLKRVHGANHSSQVDTAQLELTRALHQSLQRRRAAK